MEGEKKGNFFEERAVLRDRLQQQTQRIETLPDPDVVLEIAFERRERLLRRGGAQRAGRFEKGRSDGAEIGDDRGELRAKIEEMGDVEIVAHRGHCFLQKLLVLARYPDHLRLRTEKRGNLHRGEHLLFDQREHFFLAVPRIPGLFYPSTPDPSPTDPAGKRGFGDLVGSVGDVLLPVGEIETVRGRGEQLDLLRFDAVVEVLEVIRGEVLAVVDALVVPTEVAEGHAVLHARIMEVGVEQ